MPPDLDKVLIMPCRFDRREAAFLRRVSRQTGMSISEIIRRACRVVVPKFLSGEVNIATLQAAHLAASKVPKREGRK